MVDEDLAEKCRKWVEEYCGANQNSPSKYNQIERIYQRSVSAHSAHSPPNQIVVTNTGSRFRRKALKYGLCLTVAIGVGVFCYGEYWNRTPQQSKPEVFTNSPVSYEPKKKLAYFNDLYSHVIYLIKEGKLKEADELSLRLKQEIQKEKNRGSN